MAKQSFRPWSGFVEPVNKGGEALTLIILNQMCEKAVQEMNPPNRIENTSGLQKFANAEVPRRLHISGPAISLWASRPALEQEGSDNP
jgi:hypothetical protein